MRITRILSVRTETGIRVTTTSENDQDIGLDALEKKILALQERNLENLREIESAQAKIDSINNQEVGEEEDLLVA